MPTTQTQVPEHLTTLFFFMLMSVWLSDVATVDFLFKMTKTNVPQVFSLHRWEEPTTLSGTSVHMDMQTMLQLLCWSRTQSTFSLHMSISRLVMGVLLMVLHCFWRLEMLCFWDCGLIQGCMTTTITTPPSVVIWFSPCKMETVIFLHLYDSHTDCCYIKQLFHWINLKLNLIISNHWNKLWLIVMFLNTVYAQGNNM